MGISRPVATDCSPSASTHLFTVLLSDLRIRGSEVPTLSSVALRYRGMPGPAATAELARLLASTSVVEIVAAAGPSARRRPANGGGGGSGGPARRHAVALADPSCGASLQADQFCQILAVVFQGILAFAEARHGGSPYVALNFVLKALTLALMLALPQVYWQNRLAGQAGDAGRGGYALRRWSPHSGGDALGCYAGSGSAAAPPAAPTWGSVAGMLAYKISWPAAARPAEESCAPPPPPPPAWPLQEMAPPLHPFLGGQHRHLAADWGGHLFGA